MGFSHIVKLDEPRGKAAARAERRVTAAVLIIPLVARVPAQRGQVSSEDLIGRTGDVTGRRATVQRSVGAQTEIDQSDNAINIRRWL